LQKYDERTEDALHQSDESAVTGGFRKIFFQLPLDIPFIVVFERSDFGYVKTNNDGHNFTGSDGR